MPLAVVFYSFYEIFRKGLTPMTKSTKFGLLFSKHDTTETIYELLSIIFRVSFFNLCKRDQGDKIAGNGTPCFVNLSISGKET